MFEYIDREYDVLVVGVGPAGSSVARHCAEKGLKTLAVEKRQEIGSPKRCGEGLSRSAAERMEIKVDNSWISKVVKGASIYAPNGKKITADFDGPEGWIIERKMLDKYLAKLAVQAGARVLTKTEVIGARRNGNRLAVKLRSGNETLEIGCKILVACDGIESRLPRMMGIDTTLPLSEIASCAQFEMTNVSIDPDRIELYFGNAIAPGGYCLTPDTEIITKNTLKPISDVKIGEEVFTMKGWVPASAISIREYDGEIITITPFMFNNEVRLTPGHLVYIWNKKDGFAWKKAKEIIKGRRGNHRDGDYLILPIPKEKRITHIKIQDYVKGIVKDGKTYPIGRNQFGAEFAYKHGIKNNLEITEKLMEFFGYYVSEGNTNSNGIIISNTDKNIINRVEEIGEETFGFEASLWKNKKTSGEKTCVQVHFASKILKQLFESLFGRGCHNKHIPHFFFGLDDELKIAFLKGLFRGDGNKEKKSKREDEHLNLTTTSKRMLYDLWMFLSTINIAGSVGRIKKKNAYRLRIYGKQLKKLDTIFGECKYGELKNSRSFVKEGFLFMGVRSLRREKYTGKVYDIQSNGSFCPGFIVHNCWIFPKGKDSANVGIGVRKPFSKRSAISYLRDFIREREALRKGSTIEANSGGVPVGGFLRSMVADNFVVVGDAAHQVNPIHGGGIAEAYVAGRMASETIAKAIKANDYSKAKLAEYERRWWKERGERLKRILKLRHVVENLKDDELNWLAEYLNGDELVGFARASGFKRLALILMKKPRLVTMARKLL
jgi:flavin-dependent dehydrogenase/intein/homing endonuclease